MRFTYILMSIDEIGFQYYLGKNNDTMDNSLYHFNYFISLVTGVFDNLAIETNTKYNLGFENNLSRVSLNPRSGRDFLRAFREDAPTLRQHISKFTSFIKLIYEFREFVIHRDMLEKTGMISTGKGKKWEMNFIRTNPNILQFIRQCGDSDQKYDLLTKWGLYKLVDDEFYLEPFRFTKTATRMLIDFSNEYLELLDIDNSRDEAQNNEVEKAVFRETALFNKGKLGF